MPVHEISKYKTIKDENGNKITVEKTKEEWDRQTCKGTKIYFFENRYTNANGKRDKYRSKNYALKRDAKAEEAKFLNDPINYILSHKKSFKLEVKHEKQKHTVDMLWNQMLNDNKKNKESSLYTYESGYNCHIKDYFIELGKYLEDITKIDIKNWKNYMDSKTQKNNKPYALKYKQKLFSALKKIFQYAKDEEFVDFNLLDSVPDFENNGEEVEIKEIRYQKLNEFYRFMSVVDDMFWYAFFSFTFWHGPREGEEQALYWSSINEIDKWAKANSWEDVGISKTITVKIYYTLSTKVRGGGYKRTSTKNKRKREIPIAPEAQKPLFELYKFYSKLDGFNNEWYVFGGIRFLPMTNMNRKLDYYYNKVDQQYFKNSETKVNRLTHHEFGRHSIASHLRNMGATPEDVAEYLGDTVEVIENTYYHSYTNERLERIQNML